jgi:hypothetical protein
MKPALLYPSYIKQYIGVQEISVHNEKWYLKLCVKHPDTTLHRSLDI